MPVQFTSDTATRFAIFEDIQIWSWGFWKKRNADKIHCYVKFYVTK